MNDDEIINLFLKRDENGIIELSTKYHPYCYKIAWNLLANREDAEECLNDTWFSVWSQIPPTHPPVLAHFCGPVILVYSLPALRTACVMLVTMLTMLTIAIKKDWFTVRKKRTICGIWAVFLTAPIAAFLGMYLRNRLAEYQIARIQAMFSSGSETDYLTKMLHSLWRQNKLIGKSKSDVTGILPAFNADYILTYLSSVYGIIAAILLCCVLAVLIFAVFNTALRQKNQLGMMMGCGCGIVFLISFLINVLENLGVFPQSITFLPFFSAGGSCIIISYGLMGIVLSTYRYKNIYPRHPETGFMSINSKVKKVS